MPPLVVHPSSIRPSTARPQFSPLVPSSNPSRKYFCVGYTRARPTFVRHQFNLFEYFLISAFRDDMLAGLMAAAPWAWMRAAATTAEWLNISEETGVHIAVNPTTILCL